MKVCSLVTVVLAGVILFADVSVARQGTTLASPPHVATNVGDDKNLASFDQVWQTIKDTHWDQELVGENWTKYRNELRPRVKAAQTTAEAREIMTELISRLEQSHFGIIPLDSYDVMGNGGGNHDAGITIRMVEGELVVTEVRPESPAAKAGVVPGWSVRQLRGKSAEDLVKRFEKATDGPQRLETIAGLACRRLTSGQAGDTLTMVMQDEKNQTREMKLPLEPSPGKMKRLGNLPPIRVSHETRTLPGEIGYYRFSAFLDPFRIMPAYRNAVRSQAHGGGVIIDLRGNIGGLAAMTMGMAGEFVTEPQKLGTMTMKGQTLNFVANPRAKPLDVPVAVLVDECSISSAEILAGGLQDLKLARVFGQRTAGLALPSTVVKLPNGDGFQYAIADYHSAAGKTLELHGVAPDQEVVLTKESLLLEGDPVLNQAMKWIEQQNNK